MWIQGDLTRCKAERSHGLASQFQLGLELTNIFNPISQAVSTLGSLALVDAINKSGSDAITEMKLVSLIGRHRIDPVINFHFREVVAKADRSFISRYADIVLESGSGPTVQEALKNPALFSMVIQLSGLAFAHEDESLANAFVEAIERNIREAKGEAQAMPDYDPLLGTLRACRQQTVAFRWASLYEAVEHKVYKACENAISTSLRTNDRRKKRKNQSTERSSRSEEIGSVQNRSLPFPVLQGLLLWLQSLQSFPEERMLHLSCDSGISTVIVWCHHILGMSVTVNVKGAVLYFGDGPSNIVIEESTAAKNGITLMNPADPHEPLFTLASSDANPEIGTETRAEALGYGHALLADANISGEDELFCSHWTIAKTIAVGTQHPSKERLISAGMFFFRLDLLDLESIDEYREMRCFPDSKRTLERRVRFDCMRAIIVTFARILGKDLENCGNMPLSLHAFPAIEDVLVGNRK